MKSNELKITPKEKEVLSKQQIEFNRLSKKIEQIRIAIVDEEKRCDSILDFYLKKLKPLEAELGEIFLNIVLKLDELPTYYKITKKQSNTVSNLIIDFIKIASHTLDIELREDIQTIFSKHNNLSYKEEMDEDANLEKEMFAEMFANRFGIDLDPTIDYSNPEEQAKLKQKLEEKFSADSSTSKTKKKSKAQLKKEEEQKQLEEIKNKSLRSIYIKLAKVLHPDTEQEADEKLKKEELMKKLINAYDNKDLTTLLKMEMEWTALEAGNLDKLSAEKLKGFNTILKEQVKELQSYLYSVPMNPRYQVIEQYLNPWLGMDYKIAFKEINQDKKRLTTILTQTAKWKEDKKLALETINSLSQSFNQLPF